MKQFITCTAALAIAAILSVQAEARPANSGGTSGKPSVKPSGPNSTPKIDLGKSKVEMPKGKIETAKPKIDLSKGKVETSKGKVETAKSKIETPKIETKPGLKKDVKAPDLAKAKLPETTKGQLAKGKDLDVLKNLKGKDYCKKFGGDCKKPYCFKTGKCIDFHGHCHIGFHCNFWSHRCYYPSYGCYLYWDPIHCVWYYWCEPYGCYYPIDFVPCGVYSFETIVVIE